MNLREKVIKAHRVLLNGSGELSYFSERGITEQTVREACIGYENGALLYPCRAKSGSVLGLHYKSQTRDAKGKRRQWWRGYAEDLPPKGCSQEPDAPAKIIPFGLETLKAIDPGSQVILCCGEEDALSLRQVGYTSVSQPGAGLLEPVYAKEFANLEVTVFYDAGEEQEARKDALTLLEAGALGVRVVRWHKDARYGDDINGRLVENSKGFSEWAARMIAGAEIMDSCNAEEVEGREGEPDTYTDWPDPDPLPESLPPVDSFDPAMLPECLRGWLEDIAERMQVPLDYLAAGAMVVISSLVGRKLGVYPKKRDNWIVIPNLWGMIVGRSALLKSPALAEVIRPLERLIADAHKAYKKELADYEIRALVAEAEAKALKRNLEQLAQEAAKTGNRSKLMKVARAGGARAEGAETPEPPTLRRYKTEDATVEKIGELLIENPRGFLIHRDELSGWFRTLEKPGREGDRAFYLESWNGTGSFEVDRIGRGSLHIPALCLSILGGIQPGPLSSYVYQAVQGEQGADRLLQRFQLTVWPDPPKTWRNVDRYPDLPAKNRVYEVFKRLNTLKVKEAARDEEVPALRFDSQAQEVFDTWRDDLERRLRSEEMAPALEAHVAKYRSLMPSLALLFELIDSEELPGSVGKLSALRAVAWCEYLETHAGRLYASAEKPAIEGARALLQRIRKGEVKDGSSLRGVYHGRHWSKLSTPEEASAAAAVLEEYGWLRLEKAKTGGRPTTRIRLHPSLREGA